MLDVKSRYEEELSWEKQEKQEEQEETDLIRLCIGLS